MNTAEDQFAQHYLADTREMMQGIKRLGERALVQLAENEWHRVISIDGNSAAVLVQHLAGNMYSRWEGLQAGYVAGVEGETPHRNRDSEFEEGKHSSAELMERWEAGWKVFLDALDQLKPADLGQTMTIRAAEHTILEAIQRQVAHYSGHVYQLVFLVKTIRGSEWENLSVPRGESEVFNVRMMGKK